VCLEISLKNLSSNKIQNSLNLQFEKRNKKTRNGKKRRNPSLSLTWAQPISFSPSLLSGSAQHSPASNQNSPELPLGGYLQNGRVIPFLHSRKQLAGSSCELGRAEMLAAAPRRP
jgi:hypothetical protein